VSAGLCGSVLSKISLLDISGVSLLRSCYVSVKLTVSLAAEHVLTVLESAMLKAGEAIAQEQRGAAAQRIEEDSGAPADRVADLESERGGDEGVELVAEGAAVPHAVDVGMLPLASLALTGVRHMLRIGACSCQFVSRDRVQLHS
jgi:hypothetical protein